MTDAASSTGLEVSFAIDYHLFASSVRNPHFNGSGRLTIRFAGPIYSFSGRPRGLFAPKSAELFFGSSDIMNVIVEDRMVHLRTQMGQAGKKNEVFAFYCRDEAEARAVAALLPRNIDQEFVESHDFATLLNAVAEPGRPWASPTNLIIGLNGVMFIVMGTLWAGWFQTESMMPYVLYGANNGAATTDGDWWRLLTSMFMHYGLMHLAMNMWALYRAGHFLERLQGR